MDSEKSGLRISASPRARWPPWPCGARTPSSWVTFTLGAVTRERLTTGVLHPRGAARRSGLPRFDSEAPSLSARTSLLPEIRNFPERTYFHRGNFCSGFWRIGRDDSTASLATSCNPARTGEPGNAGRSMMPKSNVCCRNQPPVRTAELHCPGISRPRPDISGKSFSGKRDGVDSETWRTVDAA